MEILFNLKKYGDKYIYYNTRYVVKSKLKRCNKKTSIDYKTQKQTLLKNVIKTFKSVFQVYKQKSDGK